MKTVMAFCSSFDKISGEFKSWIETNEVGFSFLRKFPYPSVKACVDDLNKSYIAVNRSGNVTFTINKIIVS